MKTFSPTDVLGKCPFKVFEVFLECVNNVNSSNSRGTRRESLNFTSPVK
jgi:hypothetical protein